jgi:uncharacterized membrane-anchored protein YitT (DUF2179 family)
MKQKRSAVVRQIRNTSLIVLGVLSAGMGVRGFLVPAHFIDGGVTGISMLLAHTLGFPLSFLLVAINLPFLIIGYKQIGKIFAIKSAMAITGLAICLFVIRYPDVTSDKVLTAVFGGFFLGAGIGLAIRGGAVLDGTEIAALLISKNSDLLRVGDIILLFNIFIFLAAAFLLSVENALYSMLTYFAASRTIDFLIHGIEEYTAVVITSEKSDEIREAIIRDLRRTATVYAGRGGRTDEKLDILYCVVTRLEIGNVKNLAKQIDETAFIITHSLADVEGGVIKKVGLHQ